MITRRQLLQLGASLLALPAGTVLGKEEKPSTLSPLPLIERPIPNMVDNMQANFGRVPDEQQRAEMLRIFKSL